MIPADSVAFSRTAVTAAPRAPDTVLGSNRSESTGVARCMTFPIIPPNAARGGNGARADAHTIDGAG